jgi:ribosomal protein S3AE
MAKHIKVSKTKVKKKRWFPIQAPGFLGQKEIGESYLTEANTAAGRIMKVNLRELTGNMRDQHINVSLRIKEVSGNILQTEVRGYAYMPFFVGKLTRPGTGKIDDSFVLNTKDGRNVRLKPLAITVFMVSNSAKTAVRKKLKEVLKEELSKLNFDGLIVDLLRYKLQMDIKKKLGKICPIRELIFREVKLEKIKGYVVKKETEEVKDEQSSSESQQTETKEEKVEEKKEEKVLPANTQPSTEKEAKVEVEEPGKEE